MTKLITVTSEYEELTRLHEERKSTRRTKIKVPGWWGYGKVFTKNK